MSLQSLIDTALRRHQQGDLAGAEQAYQQALAATPANFSLLHGLGVLRAQQGRNAEAVELIGRALQSDANVAIAWLNHGGVLSSLGRLEDSLASYDRAIALAPADIDARRNRAGALFDLGRLEAARAEYARVLAARPDDAEALNDYGSILWSVGRLDEALAAFDRVLDRSPGDVQALNNRGNVLRHVGRFEEALRDYDRALTTQPQIAETWNNRGVALAEIGRRVEAVESYGRALALKPDLAEAWNNQGVTLRDLDRPAEALVCFDKALALEPDYAAAFSNRGKTLCELGRIEQAFQAFTRAAVLAYGAGGAEADAPPFRRRHDDDQRALLRQLGRPDVPFWLEGGERLPGPAITTAGAAEVTGEWRAREPRVAVIDDFLTPDALEALRRFCWRSTVWRKSYAGGYLGAFPESGFAAPLLAQIAEELGLAFPAIIGAHPLRYLWGFKYGSEREGTHVHADEAAVNVNFWITPDEANLDPASGGLVLWDAVAPAEWDFAHFNNDRAGVEAFLAQSGATRRVVPHRANRAVIFDSNLFHATDTIRFNPDYLSRRINITMLFGRRRPPTGRS
jgi:tetratricopeptide (TPR) repeat protein